MKTIARTLSLLLAMLIATGSTFEASAQVKGAYGQRLFLLKSLKPASKTLGVIGAELSDEDVQSLTRAGLGQGLTVIVARPKNAREVSLLYKKLVSENKIDLLLAMPGGGDWFEGASVEFLRENAALDRVGLCVPTMQQLTGGALCTIQSENGKFVVHVNQKAANVVGAVVPAEQSGSIAYVVQ
ncbi:MAG: hypothetical protein MUE68_02200 [Bacteroidetes bacterium]|jgi:hypothetical protein|nr:hypothetical protein [Bacteroidota bacterium]